LVNEMSDQSSGQPSKARRPCPHDASTEPSRCNDCLHEHRLDDKLPECFESSPQDPPARSTAPRATRLVLRRRQPATSSALVGQLLRERHFDDLAERARTQPATVSHLVRCLYHPDAGVRWSAAEVLGRVSAMWMPEGPRRVEQLLQRLAWALNDESGTTGWGVPQAIGEVARHDVESCDRYGPLLAGWLGQEEVEVGNSLMVQGVIHAVGRLAAVRSPSVRSAIPFLRKRLTDGDATVRALAARALGACAAGQSDDLRGIAAELRARVSDSAQVQLYDDGTMQATTVAQVALRSLEALGASA